MAANREYHRNKLCSLSRSLCLIIFYLVVKGTTWLVIKVDKTPMAEELILTTLVLAYFVFDLWVISVDFLGFRLIKNHYYLTPVLVIIVLIYSLWAEHSLKKNKLTPF